MSARSGLRVRQHRRREVELPIEFVVCEAHRAQVRFSASSDAAGEHTVCGTSIDISLGGMGVSCRQLLPRVCEGSLRVFDPTPVGTKSDGSPVLEVGFEHLVKVRRVRMTSGEPTYFIGLSFLEPEPDLDRRIAAFIDRLDAKNGQSSSDQGAADA